MSIAEKILRAKTDYDEVYEAGYEKGKSEGGTDTHYDTFWDSYQDNGNRTDYFRAFSGKGWNDETFTPKYTMKPVNAESMFGWSNISCVECGEGKRIDFTNTTTLQDCFRQMPNLVEVGDINASNTTSMRICFQECRKLVKIGTITVSEKCTDYTMLFSNCVRLTTVAFSGIIAQTIPLGYSPLTVESMKSAISCLKNYVGTDNELKYTIGFSSKCWAALEADSTSPTGSTWKEYVQFTLGWNV